MTFTREAALGKKKSSCSNYFKGLKREVSEISYFRNADVCPVLVTPRR